MTRLSSEILVATPPENAFYRRLSPTIYDEIGVVHGSTQGCQEVEDVGVVMPQVELPSLQRDKLQHSARVHEGVELHLADPSTC